MASLQVAWSTELPGSGTLGNASPAAADTAEHQKAAAAFRSARADIVLENYKVGTLKRYGLGYEDLKKDNARLIYCSVTGFGQTGPYRNRPGFATIAESMSGLAAISGEPDGQPLLPAIALTDEVTALVAAFATMVAVHSGVGQVVDVNLLESLFQLMGPLPSAYAVLGYEQPRLGSGIPYTVPRGTYRTADGPGGASSWPECGDGIGVDGGIVDHDRCGRHGSQFS